MKWQFLRFFGNGCVCVDDWMFNFQCKWHWHHYEFDVQESEMFVFVSKIWQINYVSNELSLSQPIYIYKLQKSKNIRSKNSQISIGKKYCICRVTSQFNSEKSSVFGEVFRFSIDANWNLHQFLLVTVILAILPGKFSNCKYFHTYVIKKATL